MSDPATANEVQTIGYVEFFYPGAFVSETSCKRCMHTDASKVKTADGCFAFQFFRRQECDTPLGRHYGKETWRSGMYYPAPAKTYTVAAVKKLPGNNRILISNMEGNGYDRVVKTRCGNFQPFNDGDAIIPCKEESADGAK